MRPLILVLCLVFAPTLIWAKPFVACDASNRSELQSAVVQLTFMYEVVEKDKLIGHRGTGLFISPTKIATVEHVVGDGPQRSGGAVNIGWSRDFETEATEHIELPIVNIEYVSSGLDERIAIIEIPAGVLGRTEVGPRYAPLSDNEPVFGIGYRDGVLHFVHGRHMFPEVSDDPPTENLPPPPLLFELADWENTNRMIFDYGSSGSPVFDCHGRVVSLVTMVITQDINLGGFGNIMGSFGMEQKESMRVSTPWGSPNVIGVYVSKLPVYE